VKLAINHTEASGGYFSHLCIMGKQGIGKTGSDAESIMKGTEVPIFYNTGVSSASIVIP